MLCISCVYVIFMMYIYCMLGILVLISVNVDYNDCYCCYMKIFYSISYLLYIDYVIVLKNFGECILFFLVLEYLFLL